MTKYLKLITIGLFSAFVFSTNVVAEDVLSWSACVEEARKNHPDIISAYQDVRQSQADKDITKSGVLPEISTDLTGKRKGNGTITDTGSYSVSGKQLLFDGFKISNDIASASKMLSASEYSYLVTSSNLRLELREAFIDLLKAQQLLTLTKDIAERRRQNLELVRLLYESGGEHKGAFLTAQAELSQAEFEVSQAKRNIELSQRKLIKELGRSQLSPVEVDGTFEDLKNIQERPNFESLSENTPLLKKLISLKEAAQYDLKSAKADFFPSVYLNTSLGKTNSGWPPTDREWSLGLSLSFPLFEGGKRIAQAEKAESLLEEAEADQRSGRDQVIYTLAQTWTDLQDAIEKRTVKEKFLQAAKERAEIANAQYSTGLISFDDWTIIEDNLVTAQKSFLEAKADVLIKKAYWVQAKGGTLDYVKE
ncbi:MAG: TolC family protein [Candidatus Omnitrophica bacterium]|nr:TolC family protein [Candidatus Omnitrophota bacterium]MCF7887752.1 TolC family protein [Candidatus Omnitrophota bacterium]